MSTPITQYTVTTFSSSLSPVAVNAQTFTTDGGILVFLSASSQPVAAFAPGQWVQVEPVVTP
jgi:hypothetical protein